MLSEKLLALFKQYIELDTSLESGENYPAAVSLIEAFIEPLGFKTKIIDIPEDVAGAKNRVNLIAEKLISPELPTIIIYNHIDTVPADYINAFKFEIRDGKAFGRGAADQKGGTIAVLSVLENLVGKKLRFNLIFLLTTDEENSQKEQLKFLSTKINIPKDTVVFDPDTEADGVTVGNLSLLQFCVHVLGKSAHSASSNMGENSVEKSVQVMSFLLQVKKEYEGQRSKYKPMEGLGIKYACSRCNINMIKGGIAPNVVPDKCTITVDCRFIPEKDLQKEKTILFNRMQDFCSKENIKIEINNIFTIEGGYCEHKLIDELCVIQKEVMGGSGKFIMMGSTDAAEWTNKLGLAHFGIGVMRPDSNIHGVNENCNLKDIENLSLTLQKFLVK